MKKKKRKKEKERDPKRMTDYFQDAMRARTTHAGTGALGLSFSITIKLGDYDNDAVPGKGLFPPTTLTIIDESTHCITARPTSRRSFIPSRSLISTMAPLGRAAAWGKGQAVL